MRQEGLDRYGEKRKMWDGQPGQPGEIEECVLMKGWNSI